MKNKIRYYKQDGTEYSFSKEPEIKIRQTRNLRTEMNQTAVEWYEKEINSLFEKYEAKQISPTDFLIMKHNLFYPAKEMEKEQIKEAFLDGYKSHPYLAEQYYKENYEKK
jgi:hypothetical protein